MKITGKIIYSVNFECEIDEKMFKDPDCKDTGYVNDWILDTAEEEAGIPFVEQQAIEQKIRKASSNVSNVDIIREDVIVHDLAEHVRYIRDKYGIESDGICDEELF